MERCIGCGGEFATCEGTTHAYMAASSGCWAYYGQVLAREYSDRRLLPTHRLTVDAYAVQHPGSDDRRAVQSVGLHLARLMLQLEAPLSPLETNDVMLGLGRFKASLRHLTPPSQFGITVADVSLDAPPGAHREAVRSWASAAWASWGAHHDYIRAWVEEARRVETRALR